MTTKNADPKGQNGKTTPVMKVEKPQTAKTNQKEETKQPTVEELQKQVAELEKKLTAVPQDLNSKIEYFNLKKDLIRKLTRLETNATKLQEHLDEIAELAAANEFENDAYILSIEAGGQYNKKQIFALQNPVVIGDVISYMLGKIEAKSEELKKQIEA